MNPCRRPNYSWSLKHFGNAFDGEKSVAALAPRLTAKTSNAFAPLRPVPLSFRRSKSRTIAWRSDVAKLDLPFPHAASCATEHAQVLFVHCPPELRRISTVDAASTDFYEFWIQSQHTRERCTAAGAIPRLALGQTGQGIFWKRLRNTVQMCKCQCAGLLL